MLDMRDTASTKKNGNWMQIGGFNGRSIDDMMQFDEESNMHLRKEANINNNNNKETIKQLSERWLLTKIFRYNL